MDMSAAALPPIQPSISSEDRAHPLFKLYQQHRSFCDRKMIEASSFRDWLYQYEDNLRNDEAAKHPQYPAFLAWMRAEQGGARKCPAGSFPHNMFFWIEGGRW